MDHSEFNENTSGVPMILLDIVYYVKEITFDYCFTMDFFFFNSGKNAGFCSDKDSVARLWGQVPLSEWNVKCCVSGRQI